MGGSCTDTSVEQATAASGQRQWGINGEKLGPHRLDHLENIAIAE